MKQFYGVKFTDSGLAVSMKFALKALRDPMLACVWILVNESLRPLKALLH
jgi:hypothetical protein